MIRRTVLLLLVVPLLVLVLLGIGAWWIVDTPGGTRWLWHRAASVVPGDLAAESIDGALAESFSARGVRYVDGGVEVTVSAADFALRPHILPFAATLVDVRVGDVVVRQTQAPSGQDTEAVSLPDILSALRLPLQVEVASLTLDSLQVVTHDGRRLFIMQSVSLAGKLHDAIELARARLELGDLQLEAAGRVGLSAPHALDGTLAIGIDRGAGFPGMPLRLDTSFSGDIGEVRVEAVSETPEFSVTGLVRNPGADPRWDLRLRSDDLQWPLAGDTPVVRGRGIDLASRGGIQDYTLQGTADVEIGAGGRIAGSIDADGDTRHLDVARLTLSGELVEATVQGRLGWADGFEIEGVADVGRFDPHRYLDAWPEDRAVAGEIDAAWTAGSSIELAGLQVNLPGAAMSLEAHGTIDAANGVVDLALDWQALQWPVVGDRPQVSSDSGRVTLSGQPDDWRVDGRLALEFAGFPGGTFELRGKGDREKVALDVRESRLLGGTLAGSGQYDWKNGSWAAALKAGNLHTGPVVPEWPGVVNAQFTASGRIEPLRVDVQLQRFDGTLRDLPVSGAGGVHYAPRALRFNRLRVDSGSAFLEIDGDLRSDAGIDFSLDVDHLDAFIRSANGAISGQGNVALPDGFPRLQVALDGSDLAWQKFRAGRISVASREAATGPPIDLQLQAEDVVAAGRPFASIVAAFQATPEAQRLEAKISAGTAVLEALLDGEFDDWRRPLESGWRGRLESLRLDAGEEFRVSLLRPADLRLSPETISLDDACLAGEAALQLCGSGRWSGAGDFRGDATLTAFPLDALQLIVDTGLEFTQTLDGSMTFSRSPGRALSGEARLDVSGGRVRNRLDSRLETTTKAGLLEVHLDNGQLLSGQLRLPFSQASQVDAQFRVRDVGRGDASPVEGQLNLAVADIGVAANVLPMIDAAAGRLEANIALSGTVGEPRFSGDGSLENGRVDYEPLGLRLTDMQLHADIKEQNRVELQGTFRAGAGTGRLYTSADYLSGRQAGLRVRLSGQNLTVVDVPDVRVVANPELDFGLDEGSVTINGRVIVPQARFSPQNLLSNPVRESGDVVVVAGQDPDTEDVPEEGSGIAINGKVDLVLGDDIVIDLDIADARVSGKTAFRWSGPVMPVADGQYEVTGSFQAYGQLLQITEGIVGFPNVPANNPQLRIRAEREIFGNSQIRSAGVFITGTAKAPEVEVYTNPATTESRALSLLVTGSDFNFEQGVGAVDVGTYIAPKLYLSYGIGLFDRENVISLRYDFAKGFGVKASSSTRTDGVDLSYTLER